jgi:peptidoglycan/xylan/chitin deacetylase (PgdA/CDA1 family)
MSVVARRALAVGALAACGAVVALIASGGGSSETASTGAGTGSTSSGRQASRYPASWRSHRGPVPIVEYHAIQPPVAGSPYPQLFVPQADFEAQMTWLHDHGYEAVTLKTVERAWDGRGELPKKPVVVTFDDGYRSQFVGGFPIMQRFGWPGVLDLKAQGSDLPDADARKMIGAGWELASHTINHLDVTTLDQAGLVREIGQSRQELQNRFGVRVTNFCYPAGHYDQAAIAELHRAGYVGATTELPGLAERSDPYTLARLEIELDDGLQGFVAKLQGASPQGSAPPSA